MDPMWALDLIPCEFNGVELYVQRLPRSEHIDIVRHKGPGQFGAFLQPSASDGPTLPITAVFVGNYFQAHKTYLTALQLCVQSFTPGKLLHSAYGLQLVFPEDIETEITAEEHVAVVTVKFARQNLEPEVLVPSPWVILPTFEIAQPGLDMSSYLALLVMSAIMNSQLLASIAAMIRLAGSLPSLIVNSAAGWGTAFCAWVSGYVEQYYTDNAELFSSDIAEALRDAWDVQEAVANALITDRRLDESELAAIEAGTGDYDGGVWVTGLPAEPGESVPPADRHAGYVALAIWKSIWSGILANRLLTAIQTSLQDASFDVRSAAQAVIDHRRRLAAARRLVEAALGVYGASTARELSTVAHALVRSLEGAQAVRRRVLTRTWIVDYQAPLAALAQRLLGDGGRAGELRELNGHLNLDLNRLPVGTALTVPVE